MEGGWVPSTKVVEWGRGGSRGTPSPWGSSVIILIRVLKNHHLGAGEEEGDGDGRSCQLKGFAIATRRE